MLPEVQNIKFKLSKNNKKMSVAILPEVLIGARYDAMTCDKCDVSGSIHRCKQNRHN